MNNASLIRMASFSGAVLPRRSVADGRYLEPGDSAIHAVTDFTREYPATVDEDRQIDDVLNDMIRIGVRSMLVMRELLIVGLITSYDIQGERPLQFLQTSNYTRHQDIRVGHVMTPREKLTALDWNVIQSARAGDLLQLLEDTDLTHLLVIDAGKVNAAPIVRGVVSRARLARQLRGLRQTSATVE